MSDFVLDKYEVTVGRFRQFVVAYDLWHGAQQMPRNGDGANPNNLATGWKETWNAQMPTDSAALIAKLKGPDMPMWTDTPGANENYPINYVTWYEAFAFCIWDKGRLPTEAEWEYTAAAGSQNRLYPWAPIPGDNCMMGCDACATTFRLAPVGKAILGVGYWGHLDLAGNVWDFVFDYYAPYTTAACVNCAVSTGSYRVARGGSVLSSSYQRAAARRNFYFAEIDRQYDLGFRCAR